MNESVKAQFDVRVNTISSYLTENTDPQLAARAQTLIEGMREVAEDSVDAAGFEAALSAGPLNAEYGLVYADLMSAAGNRPSAREVATATARGVANYREDIAREAIRNLPGEILKEAQREAKEEWLDATRDDYLASKDAMRDDPVLGAAETAGNIFSSLKGLLGRK